MKIHEYNQMMAYLTRPAVHDPSSTDQETRTADREPYYTGGRVGFGSGTPIFVATEENFNKLERLLADTSKTKKDILEAFGAKRDIGLGGFNKFLEKYEAARGKVPEGRFKPYTMVGTEKATQILNLYDQQLATLPEANFSEIARAIYGKDDADTRKIVRSLVERERGFKRIPNPKYEGPLSEGKRASLARRTKLKKVTNPEVERLLRAPKDSGLNYHHMESKRWNVTMGNTAYVDASLNQNVLMDGDAQLEKWYRQRDALADDAIEAHKAINEKGKNFVKQKKFKGLLNFKTYDPATKKFSDFGMDLSKAIIPEGQLEELRNVPLKELTKDQKAKVVEVAQKVRDGLAKGEPGILKKGIGMLGTGLGKLFTTATSPLGAAGFAGTTIKSNIEAGKNVADAVVDPMVGAELLYPELAKKSLAKFSPTLGKILGLGKLGAKFTPVGQYLTLAGLSKEASKAIIEEANRVDQIQDVDEQMAEQDRLVRGIKGYNRGGRVGYAKGPKDPSRRAFIKGVSALAMLPIVGKYFKLAEPAAKATKAAVQYTGPVIEKIKGLEWVQFLAKRLWDEGDDVTKKAATMDGQVVRRGTLESGDEVDMIYDTRSGDVSFEVSGKDMQTTSGAYNDPYAMDYKASQVIEETGKKTKPKIEVGEATPRQVGPEDVELEGEMFDVDSAVSDLTELEAFAKKKLTKEVHKTKGTKPKNTSPDFDGPEPDLDDFDID